MVKKIVEIADIHIGSTHDLLHLKQELQFFIDYCVTYKPDLIVILGDMFDKKLIAGSPPDQLGRWFINELLQSTATIIYVYGTLSHESSNIDSYKELVNAKFQIYKIATDSYIDDLHILFLPEEYEDNKDKYYKPFLDAGKVNKYDFVFGHGLLSTVPFLEKIAGIEKGRASRVYFNSKDFQNIVSGCVDFGHFHIHTESKDGMLNYPGSFSRDSFGEEKDKGFFIREYDTITHTLIKKEFIKNDICPIYKTINSEVLSEEKIFQDIEKQKKDSYRLRVIIDTDISETKLQNILAYSYKFPEVTIEKRFRGLSKKHEEESNQELQERRSKRHELLDKYRVMNFYDVTRSLAKEKYGTEFTIEDIKELLK